MGTMKSAVTQALALTLLFAACCVARSQTQFAGRTTHANHSQGEISVQVSPASATVNVADNTLRNAGKQHFTATVRGTKNRQVTWQICNATSCYGPGTWSQYGTLTSDGHYTAPLALPNPPSFTLKAISREDPAKFGTAKIAVDRNVHWTVTVGPQSSSAPVSWPSLIASSGDKTVYYHLFHNGVEEQCTPTAVAGIRPCYREVVFHIGKGFVPDGSKG